MESALIVFLGVVPLGILGIAVLLKFVQGSDYDLFEPLTLVAFNVFLGVTGRAAWIALTDPISHSGLLLDYPQGILIDGALIVTLATATLVVGYILGFDHRLPRVPLVNFGSWSSERALWLVCGLSLASMVGVALYLAAVGAEITSIWNVSRKRAAFIDGTRVVLGYHRWLASLGRPAFFLALVLLLSEGKGLASRYGLVLYGATLAAAAWPLVQSGRGELAWLALGGIIALYYMGSLRTVARRLKPMRLAIILSVAIIAILAMTSLRAGAGSLDELATTLSPTVAAEKIFGSGNFLGIEKAAVAAQKIPADGPYLGGESLFNWVYSPIPRSLWLDKPQVSLGYRFGEEIYGKNYDTVRGGGHPPSLPVELYWNLGMPGVAVGMLLYGFVLASFYRAFRPGLLARDPGTVFAYVLTLDAMTMTMLGVDLSLGIIDLLMNLIVAVAVLATISARGSRGSIGGPGRCGASSESRWRLNGGRSS